MILQVALGATISLAQSSEIPERRDFPVNPEVQACENFYDHACSKVISSFKLRDDRSYHGFAFSDSDERLLNAKQKFLGNLATATQLSPRGKQLQTNYRACMNVEARKAEEKAYVSSILDTVNKVTDRQQFLDWVGQRGVDGDFAFANVGTYPNQEDSDWNDVLVDVSLKSLPERSYYDNAALAKDYQAVLQTFFTTIGLAKPQELATKVFDLEKEFAQKYPLPAELRELVNKPTSTTKEALLKNYQGLALAPQLAKVPERTKIRDLMPDAYAAGQKLLASTDLEVVKAYYLYRELSSYMDDAYPEFFEKKFAFQNAHLGGPVKRPAREERCTKLIMSDFGKEIDAELIDSLFPNFPREKFIALAEGVRASIIKGVEKNTWLSPESKAGAIKKMTTATLMLVRPENDEEWDFNPMVEYSETQPINNSRALSAAVRKKEFDELSIKRNKRRWLMGPLTVNAYYVPSANQFVMPIGILQCPFYDPKLPDAANLGAVGSVIGHELGHGIDDKGAKYDFEGKLKQWLSEADLKKFQERGAKLVEQFEKAGHNGKLTLGENIGDLTGLSFAYNTAFPDGQGSKEDKQSFYLQYARLYCQVIRPKLAERLLKTDPHALGQARVNEQVKHQVGFKEAFGCKPTDKMVLPEADIVKIW
jgi:putative endopeptidase